MNVPPTFTPEYAGEMLVRACKRAQLPIPDNTIQATLRFDVNTPPEIRLHVWLTPQQLHALAAAMAAELLADQLVEAAGTQDHTNVR